MNHPTKYVLRNPIASCIYPIPSFHCTLSLLQQINSSQLPEKRLPIELLLRINDELHRNPVEEITSSWCSASEVYESEPSYLRYGRWTLEAQLDFDTKKYRRAVTPESDSYDIISSWFFSNVDQMYCHLSSADLLYRLRCYFPDIVVRSNLDRYKVAWQALLRHTQSGTLLCFMDFKGSASVKIQYDDNSKLPYHLTRSESHHALFSEDAVRLLNAFFGTIDGSRRLGFYHPAANADFPTDSERYIAVPELSALDRTRDKNSDSYANWIFSKFSPTDVPSFPSLLQHLKYDIQSRKIDRLNGTTDLTTIISSALLFYRLICKFLLGREQRGSVCETSPITSIWQVRLIHRITGDTIIFMDDRGLFDIRANADLTKETMDDADALVEALCSDSCTHPYDNVVAGCGCVG